MAQRRHHYERAFEAFLRARRLPYVTVDEARRSLLPQQRRQAGAAEGGASSSIKSFDFLVYGAPEHLLLEVKGRKIPARPARHAASLPRRPATAGALQNWVTRADLESLEIWQRLFGPGFRAVLVFAYWCERQPPDSLFQEIFEHDGRWYALRAVSVDDYRGVMRTRSERWNTVHLPTEAFNRLSRPFSGPGRFASSGSPCQSRGVDVLSGQ